MNITIQRDGMILVREHDEADRYLDIDDPLAILNCLRAGVEFEDGLTVRQLMKALRPWGDVIGHLAWMDFEAWFESVDQTYLISVAAEHDGEQELSCLEIYNVISVHRFEAGVAHLSSRWDFHGRYAKPEVVMGRLEEVCSLSFTSPRSYANLPIKIIEKATVEDIRVGPPDGMRPILFESLAGSHDELKTYSSFFDVVILGFLDNLSFYGDPEDAEERAEYIGGLVADIRDGQIERANAEREMSASTEKEALNSDVEDTEVSKSDTDIFDELGIEIDKDRYQLTFELDRLAGLISADDKPLAEKLGLSLAGLQELKGGITSPHSNSRLHLICALIREHLAFKHV